MLCEVITRARICMCWMFKVICPLPLLMSSHALSTMTHQFVCAQCLYWSGRWVAWRPCRVVARCRLVWRTLDRREHSICYSLPTVALCCLSPRTWLQSKPHPNVLCIAWLCHYIYSIISSSIILLKLMNFTRVFYLYYTQICGTMVRNMLKYM